MTKNLIPGITKMLGVELGEEFKVDKYDEMTFKFAENMLVARADFKGAKWGITYVVLSELLGGNVEIVKIPWKPKKCDVYYTFGSFAQEWQVSRQIWTHHPFDLAVLDKGWVYRTEKEAQAALPAVAKELGVEYKL